ncbi:hypothetical protein QAD02_010032 [Eretmocerus hayati]|uniref:Uncharacterized protein n=1 Tax=Eretmocerus hayati TaxID=131215 RepID=A0ACC2NBD1_9HYME|nr:hypothetical protein QAD02_010032 [Eretmocerus hayati]
MDHARKIGKSEKKSKILQRQCVNLTSCNIRSPEEPIEEDRRLTNWKRWLSDRQRRQKQLATALGRKPHELMLNAHEKVRSKVENMSIMEAATRSEITNQDRYRGNPAFWKPPERLIRIGEEDEDDDDVVATRDRSGENLPPKITRVALPEFIKREKKLMEDCVDFEKINLRSKWECGDYLRERKSYLKRDIQFVEPRKAEMDDLMVIGRNFGAGDEEPMIRTPVISITHEEPGLNLLDNPEERMALKIQDREFILEKGRFFEKLSVEETERLVDNKEDKNTKKYAYSVFESNRLYRILPKKIVPLTFNLNFHSQDGESSEQEFTFENKGVRTVKIDWRNATKITPSLSIIKNLDSRFFFNKNQIVILPGQKVDIKIWFHCKRPILTTETWKLLIEPKIYPGDIMLRLFATCSGETWKSHRLNSSLAIKEDLARRVRDSTINEIIEELLVASTIEKIPDDIPYHTFFLEAEIFEARNPGYRYDSVLVNELKQLYQSVFNEEEETISWDLTLMELRSILLTVQNISLRRDMLTRFRDICFDLMRPNTTYTRKVCSSRSMAYQLLGSFLNRFEIESYLVAKNCGLVLEDQDDSEEAIPECGETCSDVSEIFYHDSVVYREMFYVKIYCLLRSTVERICCAVDDHHYFNQDCKD